MSASSSPNGPVNAGDVTWVTVASGRGLRHVQTGRVQNYALGIAIGFIVSNLVVDVLYGWIDPRIRSR